MPPPYKAQFPQGHRVRIRGRAALEQFASEWRYHDPLVPDQLEFADSDAVVEEVGFYHGGDPLYNLKGIPGVWHESCLGDA